jgi:hypothetical protein
MYVKVSPLVSVDPIPSLLEEEHDTYDDLFDSDASSDGGDSDYSTDTDHLELDEPISGEVASDPARTKVRV